MPQREFGGRRIAAPTTKDGGALEYVGATIGRPFPSSDLAAAQPPSPPGKFFGQSEIAITLPGNETCAPAGAMQASTRAKPGSWRVAEQGLGSYDCEPVTHKIKVGQEILPYFF